jgi:hypothetical protein
LAPIRHCPGPLLFIRPADPCRCFLREAAFQGRQKIDHRRRRADCSQLDPRPLICPRSAHARALREIGAVSRLRAANEVRASKFGSAEADLDAEMAAIAAVARIADSAVRLRRNADRDDRAHRYGGRPRTAQVGPVKGVPHQRRLLRFTRITYVSR